MTASNFIRAKENLKNTAETPSTVHFAPTPSSPFRNELYNTSNFGRYPIENARSQFIENGMRQSTQSSNVTPLDAYVKYMKGDFSTSRSNLQQHDQKVETPANWSIEEDVKIIKQEHNRYVAYQQDEFARRLSQEGDIHFDHNARLMLNLKPISYVQVNEKEENNYLSNHYMNRVSNFDQGNKRSFKQNKPKKEKKVNISPMQYEAPDSVRNIARSVALVSPLSNCTSGNAS